MKRIYLTLVALCALTASVALAQDLPSGVFSVGSDVATLEAGKWYFLTNHQTGTYIYENTNLSLKQGAIPNGLSASGNEGYLFCLEASGTDGSFYLKTGRGNYVKAPATSGARGTGKTPTEAWLLTFPTIDNTPGHFLIKGSNCVMVAPANNGDPKGGTAQTLNSMGDWGFKEVKTTDASQLTGRDLYNYQMSQLSLFRLKSKRKSTAYLTSTTNGSAVGASKNNSNKFSQIWVATKSGSAYNLRNGHTGEYLSDDFGKPKANATALYIQFSPNNTGTAAYINVSSKDDFSGQSCLNLGNDGTTLHKWGYANDDGCDWAIELVEDVTLDDVKAHVSGSSGFAGELTDGAYYRVYSPNYGLYMTDVDGNVASIKLNADNYAQYWQLKKSGTGYTFQNVMTEKYVQRQTATSNIYKTAASAVVLYPRRTADDWAVKWVIANAAGGGVGLHTDANHNVVNWWDMNNNGSIWQFEPVELTDEDIAAARGSLQVYNELVKNQSVYQDHLDQLFADKACTTLKPAIQAMTDEALAANYDFAALNPDMKAMVLKVKNDTWQQFTNKTTGYTAGYEKFFRVADYKIYSHHSEMANGNNFTMANSFGRLSGPTGIVANAGDIIYIYVDAAPKSECTLAVETVSTDGVAGNHPTGTQTALKQGLNLLCPSQQVMIYIFHQLNNTSKYLADYPDIKIHIEGGQLNGYWDATRGMTNADWKLLQQDLLKAPFLNLKTKHLVFQMDAPLVKAAEPNEMEGLMRIWDMIPENEESYMGVEDFEGRYRNIWNAFSGASSYMHATTYGTWYTESTISQIMNYDNMRKAGSLWGPSHEMGHNHQGSINVCGTTESSNNLFSNINTFEQGIQTSRRQLPPDVFADLATSKPWVGRDIWNTTSMFFQLYLYFHAMHHDDQFLPNLFRKLRKNPIEKRSGWDNTTQFVDGGETKTGANITYGRLDYLHLAKMICDVAEADLSEFFEAYGMFVPVENYFVGDYANYLVTTSKADIEAAKKYMQKYPKKLGNIMFIDDHILPMKAADPNNKFEGVPAANGKKSNNTSQRGNGGSNIGDVGDYEDFDDDPDFEVDGDYFTLSGSTITFKGKGYVGHKFYDKQGNLIWATNAKSATLPTSVKNLGVDNFTVVAAEANMADVPCPYYKASTNKVYKTNVYFGKESNTNVWWTNEQTDMDACLPTNAVAVMENDGAPANVTEATNVVNTDGTAQRFVIDGDQPCFIPSAATVGTLTFKKQFDGYAALNLPFAVTSTDVPGLQTASYENQTLSVTAATNVEPGAPVVAQNGLNLTLSNVALASGNYQALTNAVVLASDGQSATTVETASPFTYQLDQAVGIRALTNQTDNTSTNTPMFDLSGRRISHAAKAGIYIVGGKKLIMK